MQVRGGARGVVDRDARSEPERARAAGRRHLHDPHAGRRLHVDVAVPAERLEVEGLRAVDVGDRDHDELELHLHGASSLLRRACRTGTTNGSAARGHRCRSGSAPRGWGRRERRAEVAVRRYVVSVCTSIDGYQEGVAGDLSVMPFDDGFSRHNIELLRAASTVLHGGRTYDGGAYWARVLEDDAQPPVEQDIARINLDLEHVVVSDSLEVDPSWPWAAITRIVRRADAQDELRRLKAGDGGDVVTYGSATTWSPLLEAGLVDELDVLIGPAVLGDGGKLFSGSRVPLRLLDVAVVPDSQLVRLRYDARP
ncbi:hypothetical protein D1781_09790 [Amnibacterium setariae]|uniref:Bacterial bifunctional deaminase-reductase C-terminal domain-containing protein n=1 Tax=Amnibacterium setariae TaxID=2306585 RepID=A0A3A1TVH3_9MICO|nr:hypothetical protein D1781_09790 [Amnibacterium setariae]